MRPSLARKFGGVPAAILLLIATSAYGQDAVVANATAEAIELERAGATIRGINIVVDNVFDPSKPEENKKLYRWANKVHIRTHPNVIEAALLFKTGDRYQARVLDESARVLRARGFLADARVTYRAYDPQTNTVEVDVYVRDSWSLAPDLKLSRSGGETEWGVGLSDGNLFGTGKQLTVSYESAIDRDQTLLSYGDANVFNSRVRLGAVLSNASDGHRRSILAERPFFSLDTRWSLGGAMRDEQRVDTMYDLGEEIDEFRHDLEGISLQGGWSRGAIDGRTQRWLFGLASEEDTFLPSPEMPQTLLLPENRKFVYPWVGWQLIQDDYREMSELNDMGRTEERLGARRPGARAAVHRRRVDASRG
jgi:Surface antigen variable number repeat